MSSLKFVVITLLAATLAHADDVVVTQKEKTFIAPNGQGPTDGRATELTVKKGQSVTFSNDDSVAHNVFSKGAKFNLKIQAPGEKKAVTFDEPGTHEVRCAIHPKMMLKVTVTP